MRSDWIVLPDAVVAGVAELVGGIIDVYPASSGNHAEIASAVIGSTSSAFVKAASGDLEVRSLRYELSATRAVDWFPPAILWHFERDGWLVVGAELLVGPHANLSPGSTDLELLGVALKGLQENQARPGTWFTPETRLGFSRPEADGGTLIHSDLNPANLIVTTSGMRVVDWAYATRAAPWVELALLVQWLIGSGHTPEQAEDWLAQFPAWAEADPEVLDDFASRNASKWAMKSRQGGEGWVHDLAAWTCEWAAHRA
ncbi:phosphotransferase [Micromonospora sp. WMMD961]|uniref:phosphotransferase n=1 Tax=Micromonospora sp. WMMD961 TaxID=3016100 RepID=UPI002416F4F8|nr:phosphotransferase [Micromonospora sp. WMMD961]MDG4783211.1 phosphotransferase [Micromonospora sp. WMMD961]